MALAGPAPQPTVYSTPANSVRRMRFTFELDSDMVLLAEDHAQSSGMTLAQWINVHANESLRMLLCG